VIGYEDGSLDLIKRNVIVNVPDIRQSSISGLKRINKIICSDNYAYLCCGLGVVVYDIEKEEVKETYQIKSAGALNEVFDLAKDDSCFYAATNDGIYFIRQQHPQITFYESWKRMQLPDSGQCIAINFWKNKLIYYLENSHNLYYQTPGQEDVQILQKNIYPSVNSYTPNITVSNNKLIITSYQTVSIYSESYHNVQYISQINLGDAVKTVRPVQAVFSDENQCYIADYDLGLLYMPDISTATAESIMPNGPFSYHSYNFATDGTKMWVASGGHVDTWASSWNTDGLYCFDGYSWNNFNPHNGKLPGDIFDVTNIVVHPTNKDILYIGTWGKGLIEMKKGVVTNVYNADNSSLQNREGHPNQGVFIAGVAFDSKGEMWIANSSVRKPVVSLDAQGNWNSENLGTQYSNRDITSMIIDRYDNKWLLARDGKLIIYNENSTAKIREIGTSNSDLEYTAYSIAEDKDGSIWVGTDHGVFIIRNTYNILTLNNGSLPAVSVDRPKLSLGGHVDYLLNGETIVNICVDGANDKWCSSSKNGIYKVRADGLEELAHYTAQNSPLLSNNLLAACITDKGEVFMATGQGIVSYRDETSNGATTNSDVYAFPNPVKPDYQGVIAIKGVVNMAEIKITDISGNLVYSTKAKGGQAIWNARDFNGKRVQTGVYIVFITNDDGQQTTTTKIMVLN
jgi:hypothetical protein